MERSSESWVIAVGERAVGDVDEAVGEPEQRVGDVGVDERAGRAEVGDGEDGDVEQQQRERARRAGTGGTCPSGVVGLVDEAAGEEVGEPVPDAHDEEQRPDGRGGDPDDVGVVEEQEHRRHREREVVARRRRRRSRGTAQRPRAFARRASARRRGAHARAPPAPAQHVRAAFGRRSRVKTPFLLPSTRRMPGGGGEVGEVPDLLADDRVDPGRRRGGTCRAGRSGTPRSTARRDAVQAGERVGAVLGHDDRLAVRCAHARSSASSARSAARGRPRARTSRSSG